MPAPHAPLPPHTIRAYDIRGLAPEEIDAEAAAHVGRGFASWVRRQGGETVAIGHDARPTSSELYHAAIDGLTSAGVAVTALGLCPTPVVGWAVDQLTLGGGMIVTASHNPPTFNGFKLLGAARRTAALRRHRDRRPRRHGSSCDCSRHGWWD